MSGLVVAALSVLTQAPHAAAAAQTVVSLTFDDGRATAYNARPILAAHDMAGTFYVNSPELSTSSFYMTLQQVRDLSLDGNEIGGHDAYHANLTQVDSTEQQRQICDDRDNLLSEGFQVRSFAYPYGAYNAGAKAAAAACGYNSARSTDVVTTPAESVPPRDGFAIRIGTGSLDLGALEGAVSSAVNGGGGWVPLMFHDVCNGCSAAAISPSDFSSLLDWLAAQAAKGVIVKTVGDVIGGASRPAVQGPAMPPAPTGTSTLHNASVEYSADGYSPDCFSQDGYGNNAASWTRTSDAHSGSWAQRLDVSGYTSGDRKLMITQDLGSCTPSVVPGHRYRVGAWYKATTTTAFLVDLRGANYSFGYWMTGSDQPVTNTWTQISWITPPIPDGATGISFGLALTDDGSLTVDDVSLVDADAGTGSDTTPPSASVTAPADGAAVAGTVDLTAAVSDDIALDHADFLIDGKVVNTWVTGTVSYGWNSRTVSNGVHTLVVRAVDTSGNATTSASRSMFVSNQSANLLQNPSLENASGSTPSCWLLGGYGTNTPVWTRSTDAHTGASSEALQITSWTSGDRKLVNSQDAGTCSPPAIPGHTYTASAWYKGSLPSYLFAYYRSAAGVWTYLSQSAKVPASSTWTQASWSTPPIPSGATNLSVGFGGSSTGTVTMDDLALVDNTPVPDTVAPTSSITCNGGIAEDNCSGWFNQPVLVRLTAADDAAGSGIATIRFTTDGTDPSPTNGNTYIGPFSTTGSIRWRAYDRAGNAETIRSQQIRSDTAPPASTISCNGWPCNTAPINSSVSVTLAGVDTGGSGVQRIVYTTDGSEPTVSNGRDYMGAFSISANTTVTWRAYDNAGNSEAVKTQALHVDLATPTSSATCNGQPCTVGWYDGDVTLSLAAVDDTGGSGVAGVMYTTDGTTPTAANGSPYTGPIPLASTTSLSFRAFDQAGNYEPPNVVVIHIDSTAPTLTIACDVSCSADSTASAVVVTVTAQDGPNGSGISAIRYTLDGSDPRDSTATPYTAPVSITATSTFQAVAVDNAGNVSSPVSQQVTLSSGGDTTPAITTISCNDTTCGSGYSGVPVSVSLSAKDNSGGSGVAKIRYTTDGTDPTVDNGIDYAAPLVVTETTTVKARAWDVAGNIGTVSTTVVLVDTTAPTVTAICDAAACVKGYYTGAITFSLTAAGDPAGSRVIALRYTTDGSDPSPTNGTEYTGSFSVTKNTTIRYLAVNAAGNTSAIGQAQILIDSAPPTSTIACNDNACSPSYYGSGLTVTLGATDDPGGSGVAAIRYTTDGTDPSLTHGDTYTGPLTLSGDAVINYRAFDAAGNAEATNSAKLLVDVTAPTTTARCNDTVCASGYSSASVAVTLTPSDGDGSGVTGTRYTLDGSTPTAATGTLYTGPFTVSSTSTLKFRSFDAVGNLEPVTTLVVGVDGTPPTGTIASPSANGLVSGTAKIVVTAADNVGVDHVDVLVDGDRVGTTKASPYTVTWDTTGSADGAHQVKATIVDLAGNTVGTAGVSVNVINNNLLSNPSLETATGATPTCWLQGGYGTSTFTWTRSTNAHTGTYAQGLSVTAFTSGDRKLVSVQDSGACAPTVSAGQVYTVTAWYTSTTKPYFFGYYRTAAGWVFWTNSASLPPSSTWTQATFRTPAIPAGATNISVGMGIDAVGSLTMDDFGLYRFS